MDYGKMAYLKAGELEERLAQAGQRQATRFFRANPQLTLSGETKLLSYRGGAFAVLINVLINSSGGRAYLKVGGLRAAENVFAEGTQQRTFMAAGSGSGEIALVCDTLKDAVLERYEVIFVGDGIDVAEISGGCNLARSGERYAFVSASDCDVDALATDSRFNASAAARVGRGQYADVCRAGEGYYIVYGDVYGVLWGVAVDYGLNVTARSYLGGAPGRVSAACYGDTVTVAYVREGKAEYFLTGWPAGVRGETFAIGFSGKADAVTLVKDAPFPAALIESGGKVFLLKAEKEQRGKDTFHVRVRGEVRSV